MDIHTTYFGTEPVEGPEACPDCEGTGGYHYTACGWGCCTNWEDCSTCRGSGRRKPETAETGGANGS